MSFPHQPFTNVQGGQKTAIVFLTHFFDAQVEARVEKLLADTCGLDWAEVHLLVEPGTQVPPRFVHIARRFDFNSYRQRFARLIGETKVPGNMHLAALWFEENHGGWERCWFIEYDVVYTGRWAEFFTALDADTSDLLATNIRSVGRDSRWYWRDSLAVGNDQTRPVKRIAAFFPIYRISKAGLEALRRACADGWSGHHEVLVPTVIHAAGLAIADIGGAGEWTPSQRRHRYYLEPGDEILHRRAGTFRYVPNIRCTALPGMLYHPCKTPSQRKKEPRRLPFVRFSLTDCVGLYARLLTARFTAGKR